MKLLSTLAMAMFATAVFAQTDIPEGTLVPIELTKDINALDSKVGNTVPFKVSRDVMVKGVKVIAANAVVHAVVTTCNRSKNGELRIDFYDVPTVDGKTVNLNDCWIFTTSQENLKGKGALFRAGTSKNCYTSKAKVDPNQKF